MFLTEILQEGDRKQPSYFFSKAVNNIILTNFIIFPSGINLDDLHFKKDTNSQMNYSNTNTRVLQPVLSAVILDWGS